MAEILLSEGQRGAGAVTIYQVKLPHATFGLEVRDGVVVRAAPIARWATGRPAGYVLSYYLRRYPGSEWQAITGTKEER